MLMKTSNNTMSFERGKDPLKNLRIGLGLPKVGDNIKLKKTIDNAHFEGTMVNDKWNQLAFNNIVCGPSSLLKNTKLSIIKITSDVLYGMDHDGWITDGDHHHPIYKISLNEIKYFNWD